MRSFFLDALCPTVVLDGAVCLSKAITMMVFGMRCEEPYVLSIAGYGLLHAVLAQQHVCGNCGNTCHHAACLQATLVMRLW
jgi:hypothetical protein